MEKHCDGCDQDREGVRKYRVTHHNGEESEAEYCPECADLARVDFNGETAAIEAAA